LTDETTLAAQLPEFGRRLTIVGKMIYIVHASMEKLWKAMANRGPDPDADLIRYHTSVPIDVVKDLMAEARRHGNGSVNGGNWKAIAIVLAVINAILLSMMAWFANTVIDTRQDVAVLKCEVNPNCRVVVTSDKP
jgi:hypothetical protein